jgi:hypothetical protein
MRPNSFLLSLSEKARYREDSGYNIRRGSRGGAFNHFLAVCKKFNQET